MDMSTLFDQLTIVDIDIYDPYTNIAIENLLLQNLKHGEVIIFLWQNDCSVILGRNQCVYSQCNVNFIKRIGANICRRNSGGGAVFHDRGNLNYSIITVDNSDIIRKNIEIIIEALTLSGIKASFTGRNDICVNGKKISGNAYYSEGDKVCHHGTILIDSNIDNMENALNVDEDKWKGKGIVSQKSRVINLKSIINEINVNEVKQNLKTKFIEFYGKNTINNITDEKDLKIDDGELLMLRQKYKSNLWVYGKNIEENLSIRRKFDWGIINIVFNIKNNRIRELNIFTDDLEVEYVDELKIIIEGQEFSKCKIQELLDKYKSGNRLVINSRIHKILYWIIEEVF